jgi:hypothetical protein
VWLVIVALLVPVSVLPSPAPARAQEAGVSEKVLMDTFVDAPARDGVLTVTRVTLPGSDRTESLLLDGPVSIAIETGRMKLWTRAGAEVDGVPLLKRTNTVYVTKGQTVVIPAGIRFRIRALGCEVTKLIFIQLTG